MRRKIINYIKSTMVFKIREKDAQSVINELKLLKTLSKHEVLYCLEQRVYLNDKKEQVTEDTSIVNVYITYRDLKMSVYDAFGFISEEIARVFNALNPYHIVGWNNEITTNVVFFHKNVLSDISYLQVYAEDNGFMETSNLRHEFRRLNRNVSSKITTVGNSFVDYEQSMCVLDPKKVKYELEAVFADVNNYANYMYK